MKISNYLVVRVIFELIISRIDIPLARTESKTILPFLKIASNKNSG